MRSNNAFTHTSVIFVPNLDLVYFFLSQFLLLCYVAYLLILHMDISKIFIVCQFFFSISRTGTKNVVNLCIKHNIPKLIYTSCASVTLTPYLGKATFAVVVNQTEAKAKTPILESGFIVPGYSSTKLRAEKIVLGAHGTNLSNGTGAKFI